jgi:hypothetical protein
MRFGLTTRALLAQGLLLVCIGPNWAAPCVTPSLTPQEINEFKSNPAALIAPDSETRAIEAMVRDLAGTDASLASDLVRLAQMTTPRFRTAIAAGLAQAAVACNAVDQQAALLIQQSVAGFDDGQFQAAFAAAEGDLSTAATEAAAASATASVGSVIVTNPIAGSRPTTTPGGGGSTALVQITSGAVATALGSPLTTINTAANPVSPTR